MKNDLTADAADARFWDRNARRYAASTIKDMVGYDRTIERTLHLLRPTDDVLEIGCGTGMTALKLAPHLGRMTATDVSGEMIAIARARAVEQGCLNVDFITAEADQAIGEPGSRDAVLAFNVIHLLRDRARVAAQALRALKPGGLFISKTTCLSEMNPLIRLAVPLMRAIGQAPHVAFFTAEQLVAEVKAAGFDIVETARHGSGRKDPRIFIVARKP